MRRIANSKKSERKKERKKRTLAREYLSLASPQSIIGLAFDFLIVFFLITQKAAKKKKHVNDPSAGSPTETLLRLLLPLNGKV